MLPQGGSGDDDANGDNDDANGDGDDDDDGHDDANTNLFLFTDSANVRSPNAQKLCCVTNMSIGRICA